MSLQTLLTQTVTVVRTSVATFAVDGEGNPAPSPAATRRDYLGFIQQRDTTEVRVGPDSLISNHILFLEPEATIAGLDRVEESGRTFEVIGDPAVVRSPRGPHHIEADLRLVTT